jgi:hypothetical protein
VTYREPIERPVTEPFPPDDPMPDVDLDAYERSLLVRQRRWAAVSVTVGVLCCLSIRPLLVIVGVTIIARGVARWRSAGRRIEDLAGSRNG